MGEFKATIIDSSRELTAKEKIKYKDLTNVNKLDECVSPEVGLIITPTGYHTIHVINEKSENPEYDLMVIESSEGERYSTSSDSFMRSFLEIWDAMTEEGETWDINVHKLESKNYNGRFFITCSVL